MLYILTPIFCVASVCGTVFSFSNRVHADEAAVVKKATGAYLDLDGSGKIMNAFEGKQKEYIYFSDNSVFSDYGNSRTGAIKWRVLSTNDNKYSNGNMLLWADYYIYTSSYNLVYGNPEYAFWGTSPLHADLNGGYYPSSTTSQTATPKLNQYVSPDESWSAVMFTAEESGAVVASKEYTTDLFGLDQTSTLSQFLFKKKGITANVSLTTVNNTVNGKFNVKRLDASTHPTASFAHYDTTNGTVWEETEGDILFPIDYYDINNLDYGFGDDTDGDGIIDKNHATRVAEYANSVNNSYSATWTKDSDWFPAHFDGAGQNSNGIASDYLDDGETHSWLRTVGRISTVNSAAFLFGGGVIQFGGVHTEDVGVRPAFNLDSTKLTYVTAKSPDSTWADMSDTSTTPAYKVYLKNAAFNSNSNSAKAIIGVNGNTLNIKYNNPVNGVSGGKLLVLLTDKNANDGSVAWQTAFSMDSSATESKSVLKTIELPTDVSLSDYNISILHTTANGENATETIYSSYTIEDGIAAPQNITVTYDGSSKWISDLTTSEKDAWLDIDIYNNPAFISNTTIKYTDNLGNPETTVTKENVKAAGSYKVTMTLASDLRWTGNETTGGEKEFIITINKKPSTPIPKIDPPRSGVPFVSAGLPTLIPDGGTPGTFTWDTGEEATVGTKEYGWTFTPAEPNNFTVVKDKMELEFAEVKITGLRVEEFNTADTPIYTSFTVSDLKQLFKIIATKNDGTEEELPTYDLQIRTADKKLQAGSNTVVIATNDGSVTVTPNYVISGVIAVSVEEILVVNLSNTVFTYPVTLDEIKDSIESVRVRWNNGTSGLLSDLSVVTVDGTLDANPSVTLTIDIDGVTLAEPYEEYIVINKGNFDISGITFTGDTLSYDEGAHSIFYSGTLPEGVSVEYDYNGTKQATPWEFTNAGTYNITLSFTHSNANYNAITTTLPATLKIDKAKVTGITFADAVQPEITGTTYTLEATGYPSWVTVEYYYDGSIFTGASAAGEYEITARFTHSDPNYEQIADMTKTLTISDKPPVEGAENIVVQPTISATYTGDPVDYVAKNVPEGVEVSYEILKDGAPFDGTEITEVGVYTITIKFETAPDKAPIASKTCVVTVGKATVDMDGVAFANATVTGNGQSHKVEATNLPDGVTVEYEYNGVRQSEPFEFTEAGEYTVKAYFTYADEDNYKAIEPKEMTLTVSDAVITGITAKVEDGAAFTTTSTLDDLKAKLTVTAVYNNGTTAEVEDYELSCNGLRDGGMFKAGIKDVTVTYGEFTTVVSFTVDREKVALPTFKGGLNYTGLELKPKAADFNGYDETFMTFVVDKTVPGLTVGSYKAVFALNDSENYEWATATTLKKAVFAAVVFDGETEVVLNANEAAVDWNISKAVLTATKTEGGLPVFASESYIGAFADVVTLKYYKDEACTEEVAAEDLAYETQYYVKAELLDTENFDLDASAAAYTVKSFTYTTPAKELTLWDKIVKFVVTNWLWLVIAVAALILLIIIIACAVRASKKKREREERRLAEEKEEKKREQEERREREEQRRREDREERMARMNQQQAMPQMMMPQMMPQMMGGQMPQMGGQPMATGGGASSGELAELKAEISALRAAQESMRAEQTAKELAEIKALHTAEQQVAQAKTDMRVDNLATRLGGEQLISGGLTAATIAEIVTAAMEKVLDSREKPAAQAPAETKAEESAKDTATPVCPPDAVMTTVTTTKIDTTKKPAQTAQAQAAPVRTVVRNIVAPMPVDDGRVFDVGGFYKPADPATDMGFTDDENKE